MRDKNRYNTVIMTINRAFALSLKREFLPVLCVQLKSSLFNALMPLNLIRERKQKLIFFFIPGLLTS